LSLKTAREASKRKRVELAAINSGAGVISNKVAGRKLHVVKKREEKERKNPFRKNSVENIFQPEGATIKSQTGKRFVQEHKGARQGVGKGGPTEVRGDMTCVGPGISWAKGGRVGKEATDEMQRVKSGGKGGHKKGSSTKMVVFGRLD